MARARMTRTLMVRLDEESLAILTHAARLRGIGVSDYVRQVSIAQARKEVIAASAQTISLTPDEQFAFWTALDSPVELTPEQRDLGKVMRGEA